MPASSEPEHLLSLNRLSRKLDISYARAVELHFRGVLSPDFTADRIYLFRETRLAEIEAAVRQELHR